MISEAKVEALDSNRQVNCLTELDPERPGGKEALDFLSETFAYWFDIGSI